MCVRERETQRERVRETETERKRKRHRERDRDRKRERLRQRETETQREQKQTEKGGHRPVVGALFRVLCELLVHGCERGGAGGEGGEPKARLVHEGDWGHWSEES